MKRNKVYFFRKMQPLYFNMDKLTGDYNGLILLTGLVGAGKTSSAENIAKKYHAIPISFDVLKFYEASSAISQEAFNEFSLIYPDIKRLLQAQWRNSQNKDEDKLYAEYCVRFMRFLLNKAQKNKSAILLEGIQIFARLRYRDIQSFPCIVLATPAIECMRNFRRREKVLRTKHRTFELLKKYYLYHFRQRQLLNRLIYSYDVHYQNLQSK